LRPRAPEAEERPGRGRVRHRGPQGPAREFGDHLTDALVLPRGELASRIQDVVVDGQGGAHGRNSGEIITHQTSCINMARQARGGAVRGRIDFSIALCNNLLVLSHRLIIEAAGGGAVGA
jgi:hypothetical protein